jgi:type IV pilus assembly protein PilF
MKFMPKSKAFNIVQKPRLFVLVLITLVFVTACASSGNSRKRTNNELVSDNAMIHAQLAKGYLQQKQYAVAKKELEIALKKDSNHSESNYVLGLLMMELEQYEDAEKYLRKAVRSDKRNSSAAHDLGTFLCQRGDLDAAVDYFEIAVANPFFDNAELSYMRAGECLARSGDTKAEVYLKKALELNPRMRPALYRMAVIKYSATSYLSARAYIERYFAITKPQPASLLLAHKIELKLKANDVAARYRAELLEEFPGSSEASELRKQLRN